MNYRPLEIGKGVEYLEFLGLFHDYWKQVNEEDAAQIIDWPLKDGSTVRTTKCEAMFEWMVDMGGKVQLAFDKGQMVGFLVYHEIFGCMIVIRCMYTIREHIGMGLGKGLIDTLPIKVKKVIFQSRKEKPPKQMLKVTEKYRTKVDETKDMITWEMPWEV